MIQKDDKKLFIHTSFLNCSYIKVVSKKYTQILLAEAKPKILYVGNSKKCRGVYNWVAFDFPPAPCLWFSSPRCIVSRYKIYDFNWKLNYIQAWKIAKPLVSIWKDDSKRHTKGWYLVCFLAKLFPVWKSDVDNPRFYLGCLLTKPFPAWKSDVDNIRCYLPCYLAKSFPVVTSHHVTWNVFGPIHSQYGRVSNDNLRYYLACFLTKPFSVWKSDIDNKRCYLECFLTKPFLVWNSEADILRCYLACFLAKPIPVW